MLTIPEKIRAIMKATGKKQLEIAEHFNVSQSTVNRWLAGSEPEGHRRDAINEAYESLVDHKPSDDFGEAVPLMGYIGAGSEIMPDFEQVPPDGLDQIHIPFSLPSEMIAFEVRGDSMLPVYKNGHIIIVKKNSAKSADSFLGQEAAVRTSDGRRFLKTIMKGSPYTLMSFNAAPIENVSIEWIGEIFAILPRSTRT